MVRWMKEAPSWVGGSAAGAWEREPRREWWGLLAAWCPHRDRWWLKSLSHLGDDWIAAERILRFAMAAPDLAKALAGVLSFGAEFEAQLEAAFQEVKRNL